MSGSQGTTLVDEVLQDDAGILGKSLAKLGDAEAQPASPEYKRRGLVIYHPSQRTYSAKPRSAYKQKLITDIIDFFNCTYGKDDRHLDI